MKLWVLNLVPPIAWALHLQTSYMLEMSVCETHNRMLLIGVSIVALAVVAVDALFAWRATAESKVARFMIDSALAGSALFALVIIGQTVPMLMLRPCD